MRRGVGAEIEHHLSDIAPAPALRRTVTLHNRVLGAVVGPLVVGLPRRQREVIALRHLVDLSEREVASVLGISAGAVKQHLHRGLASVRGRLPRDPMMVEVLA